MPEKDNHPKRAPRVFDLSWESDDEPDEVVRDKDLDESSGEDVEGHGATGFNRPSDG
jgi:hypothetical protein